VFSTTESKAQLKARTHAALELVGLGAAEQKYPHEVSGGMKQRVGIARALAMEPKVLLLDEPFGALDALTRARLQDELMRIVARTGTTTLMVTHDVDEAVLLADRIVMMTNGPAATIGDIVTVDLARPRDRVAMAEDPHYHKLRGKVMDFLYRRQLLQGGLRRAIVQKLKLVVVGNGMAGMRTIEDLLRSRRISTTSPCSAPSRIRTTTGSSSRRCSPASRRCPDIVLNGLDWYADNRITLHLGKTIEKIDRIRRVAVIADRRHVGRTTTALLLATGSSPVIAAGYQARTLQASSLIATSHVSEARCRRGCAIPARGRHRGRLASDSKRRTSEGARDGLSPSCT
jgi:energy-coupling factor transporter ATP-binding protein EcfA2